MHAFLVEHYWPDATPAEFEAATERVRIAADALARSGKPVHYLHSTLIPEDAAAYCVLSAASRDVVEDVYERAGVTFDRIVEAIETAVPSASDA